MSGVPFHQTVVGHRFFEHQLPELIRQLARIADQLEKLNKNPAPEPTKETTTP
jgi:hypothetical protein